MGDNGVIGVGGVKNVGQPNRKRKGKNSWAVKRRRNACQPNARTQKRRAQKAIPGG